MYSIFHTIPPLICVKVARCAPSIFMGSVVFLLKKADNFDICWKKRVNILPIL